MMNTQSLLRPLTLLVILLCFQGRATWCEEPTRGPLPDKQREIIQFLAEHHDELERKVEFREDGYVASTTTENMEVAAKLKEHFAYMEKRLGSGAAIRRWDPAFVELVQFHDQIETTLEHLDNGIKVVVVAKTTEAVKVVQNHARIVTGFAEKGPTAVRERHESVLGDVK